MSETIDCFDPRVNEAILLPEKLVTDDGRILLIRTWEPRINVDECVTVKIEALITLPEN